MKRGAECMCVFQHCTQAFIVLFYSYQGSAHPQKLIYVSLVMPLNEKSLMELFVVYFKDVLSARLCARQRSLCVYGDVVMSH